MKLSIFNGGLSKRLASHLIKVNEAVTYSNIDNEKGTLKSVFTNGDTGITLDEYAFYFDAFSSWISSVTERHYVEYQSQLYYTDVTEVPKRYDGTVEYLLGILLPSIKPTVAVGAVGLLTGTYTYVYTFYNSTLGYESQPSPVSLEVTVTSQKVELTAIGTTTDPQVDKVRIYRVGGAITKFSLVDTINEGTTIYSDNIADTEIEGSSLISADNKQAPSGLKYILEAYSMMFGVLDDKLYFTPIGKLYAWPATYFIDFDKTLIGIAECSLGILAFTTSKTYLITGTSPTSLSKRIFSSNQGCLSYWSIQGYQGNVVWVSSDGFCMIARSSVTVASRDKLGKIDLTITNSVLLDDVYYAQFSDNSIIAIDFRYDQGILKNLSLPTTRLLVGNDKLYGYESGKYYELFNGKNQLSFSYESPTLLDGSYILRKRYKEVLIRCTGDITVEVYISDIKVVEKKFTTLDTHEIKVPQDKQNGYSIKFKIFGIGEVFGLDYTPVG